MDASGGEFRALHRVLLNRVQEFLDHPVLFAGGTTRFDIEQGGAGTCWFLSILSSLADKPEVLKQVCNRCPVKHDIINPFA